MEKQLNKKNLFILIAVAAVILMAVAVTVVLIAANKDNGDNEEKTEFTVSEFGTIQGQFTDRKINGEDSAIAAIRDVAEILGLDNAVDELTAKRTDKIDDLTYYRISQNYKGIPVYGSSFVVVADDDGEAIALASNVKNIDEDISLIPSVTQEQINSAIYSEFDEKGNIEIPSISDDMLVVYNFDETNNSVLAYKLYVLHHNMPYNAIVSAKTGELLSFSPLYYFNKAEDTVRGIFIYDADNKFYYDYLTSDDELIIADNNHNAAALLDCLSKTYDFFDQVIGINGFNRKNGKVIGVCNALFKDNTGRLYGNNAVSVGSDDPAYTFIVFGNESEVDIDTVAHEYMHSVERDISSMIYSYESGAIMEGYSDIFGEIVEDWVDNNVLDNSCDWFSENGNITNDRNIASPNLTLNPSSYKGLYWQSSYLSSDIAKEMFWDHGGVHQNNTVISHAAYLMTKEADGCTALTNSELADLWYKTLFLLPSNCDFSELREYITLQAAIMDFSEQKQTRIELAFESVDIVPIVEEVNTNFTILISCSEDPEYYNNCRIEITKNSVLGDEVALSQDITDNSTSINLDKGNYTVKVINKNTDSLLFVREIKVNKKNTDKYVCFNIQITEEAEETTITPETTLIPETTESPETTEQVPETTVHVHEYSTTENAATCTSEGSIVSSCSCGDKKTEILPVIDHKFAGNVCSMCGLKKEIYSLGLEFKLNDSGKSYSLIGIGTCTDTDIIIPSTYENLPVTAIESKTFEGNKNIKSIVIPASIKTIGIGVLNDADSLESITFGEGLVEINTSAFYSCDSLTKVSMPESLKIVGGNAFASCKNLKNITLNEGLIEIGSGAFQAYSPFGNYNDEAFNFYGNGKYLGTKNNPYYALVDLPDSFNTKSCEIHKDTKIIACETFSNSIIEDIIIPNGVKIINTWAFFGCNTLKTVKIEGTIEELAAGAFYECKNIVYNEYEGAYYLGNDSNPYLILMSVKDTEKSSYTIHPNTKQIASNAFRKCTAIKSFEIPEHITVVGEYAFAECSALTSIVIPKSITKLSLGIFYDCTGLTEIVIPDHIVSIGSYALRGCTSLNKVIIKNNVKSIGKYAFAVCSKLNSIDFYGTEDEWNKIEKDVNWSGNNLYSSIKVNIIEPTMLDSGASEGITYQKSTDKTYYTVSSVGTCTDANIVISATCNGLPVKTVSKKAFEGCKTVISITIPSSVKTIETEAFKNCTSLKSVKLAEGVESITLHAFIGCISLEEINIPSTCSLENAFVGCTSLKTLNIDPANKKYKMVGSCLISNGNALVLDLGEGNIPANAGIQTILTNAYYQSNISEIVIPEGVTKIDIGAFKGCIKLEKVTLPESLTTLGNAVFNECTSLKEIFIPKNVSKIGINPFSNCSSLVSIKVDPENKTHTSSENCLIDIAKKSVISGCSTSIIPSDGSVTTIGQASFSGISNIKNIELNNHITKIESGAFMGCDSLEKIVIPDSVTDIGSMVIYNMKSVKEIVLGNGITSLNCISFSNMNNLQKITFGSGITVIEKYDLMSCPASEIILSKSIKKIESSAICYSKNLTAIRFEGTMAEWNVIEKEDEWDKGTSNYTVYCTDGEIKKS